MKQVWPLRKNSMFRLWVVNNMKFKELREANLSKAQIKKVHDKADDLPKNDFIKRYGKEGDAVRFATATNIVKKKLGMDEESRGVGTSRGRQSGVGYPSPAGSDSRARTKTIPSGPELRNPKSRLQKLFSDLDKEDEKSVGRVVKGLKKAVKAHQGQVDALTKDIKDEVELDEVHFSNRGEPPAPKGMHKLRSGRNIPSSSQADKIHKKVVAMTDRNDHFGARMEIAKECGDKQLVQIFNALELIHDKYSGAVGNEAIALRGKMMNPLNKAIDRKFGKYADVIQDAL